MSKVYFLSDIHLGARYIANPLEHEKKVVSMLEYLGRDATHIYLLGDILDYWFEYRTVVPRGYIRFFGELARLSDNGVKITWLTGNHDIWLFGYLSEQLGIEIIDGALVREIDGKRFYLAHGDGLGRLNKKSFRFIRSLFRNKACQKLFSAIHPRWTVPFAHRWSASSRKSGYDAHKWLGVEREASMIFAKNYIENIDSSVNFFVLGHRHLLIDKVLKDNCRLIILGDCISQFSYAEWDGTNLVTKHFDAK